jgi:hypothetical protein
MVQVAARWAAVVAAGPAPYRLVTGAADVGAATARLAIVSVAIAEVVAIHLDQPDPDRLVGAVSAVLWDACAPGDVTTAVLRVSWAPTASAL